MQLDVVGNRGWKAGDIIPEWRQSRVPTSQEPVEKVIEPEKPLSFLSGKMLTSFNQSIN